MNKYTHLIDQAIQALGYVLVPKWRWAPNTLETHLQQLFEITGVTCVIDVGANTGQYRDFLRYMVGYKGRIVSFEPVKANFDVLQQKASRDTNWQVFNFGLGASNGSAEINVMRDTKFSSLLQPDDSVVRQFRYENEVMYREQIEVRRLADIAGEFARSATAGDRYYLKSDTQGYDLQVLEGAKALLGNVVAMQMELPIRPIYQQMPTLTAAIEFSRELGFDVTGVFPVSRDKHLRIIELDCVFAKRVD